MKTFQISDRDLQALIAERLRKKLAAAGFETGASMVGTEDPNSAFYFPINLNLAGKCAVMRGEDGMWTFTQEVNQALADRTAASHESYIDALGHRGDATTV